jgi:hypothetical protein
LDGGFVEGLGELQEREVPSAAKAALLFNFTAGLKPRPFKS